MDYQQDLSQIKIPWGKIIGVNVLVTIVVAFVFNLVFSYMMPSSVFTRLKELEKNTAQMQVTLEKFTGKIKIAN